MPKIITISREFGSGGREIGKRLADILNVRYLDLEIVEAIAKETNLDENYLQNKLENSMDTYPVTFGNSFSHIFQISNSAMLIAKQHQIIKEIASKSDCVIVGRGADAILSNMNPFKIFIYADINSKIIRCKQRMTAGEYMSDKQLLKKINSIDKKRKSLHSLYASYTWGDKTGYNLCVNTSNMNIKDLILPILKMIEVYFKED